MWGSSSDAWAWGEKGHVLSGQAATLALPAAMPKFFLESSDHLGYLTAEPDRWRDRNSTEVTGAFNPDHAINFERIPPGALDAKDRFAYLAILQDAGEDASVGMAPFRALEMFQRLRTEFRLWRVATDPNKRLWIQERILNDAGLLGHYITDGAEPLHTTVNHHGWVGPNPNGYATDPQIHARFESQYVNTHIELSDIQPLIKKEPHVVLDEHASVMKYFETSHEQYITLYQLDKKSPFNADTVSPENKRFVAERLAYGAEMLRNLWWTAWVTSGN